MFVLHEAMEFTDFLWYSKHKITGLLEVVMVKIAFVGAGSTVFAKNVLGDVMLSGTLSDSEIALYDIDGERLEESYQLLSAINKNSNENRAVIKTYLGVENRKDAFRDASFVVNAIQVGGYKPSTVIDFEIPKKYGVRQTIADTLANRRYFPCAPYNTGDGRNRAGYGRGLPRCVVLELHEPNGDVVRLYAAVHQGKNRRTLPQRTGMRGASFESAGYGNGRRCGQNCGD